MRCEKFRKYTRNRSIENLMHFCTWSARQHTTNCVLYNCFSHLLMSLAMLMIVALDIVVAVGFFCTFICRLSLTIEPLVEKLRRLYPSFKMQWITDDVTSIRIQYQYFHVCHTQLMLFKSDESSTWKIRWIVNCCEMDICLYLAVVCYCLVTVIVGFLWTLMYTKIQWLVRVAIWRTSAQLRILARHQHPISRVQATTGTNRFKHTKWRVCVFWPEPSPPSVEKRLNLRLM